MIDETQGSASARKALSDALTSILMAFPLAGFTILGRSVYVCIEKNLRAPGLAYTGGIKLDENALLTWSKEDNAYLLLHEWMHVFGNHAARTGERDADLWNIACDYRVNTDVGRLLKVPKPPQGGLVPPSWVGDLIPEQIYDRLLTEKPPQPKPQQGQGKGQPGMGEPDLVNEPLIDPSFKGDLDAYREELVTELCAGEAAMSALGQDAETTFGSYIAKRLVDLKRGLVPWDRLILGDMLAHLSGQHATYAPPRRRLYPQIILPSYKDSTSRALLLGIDVSASITRAMMNAFASSCAAAALRANTTTVVTFDQALRERFNTTSPLGVLKNLQFITGAHTHTDVRPVFEVADEIKPSAIAILTDGYIKLPKKPYANTLWAVPRGGVIPPWGKHYTMEVSW